MYYILEKTNIIQKAAYGSFLYDYIIVIFLKILIENNQIKFEGEGKDTKPVLKEGKTMEEYSKEYNALMQIEVNINF